eukprot:TRINITY_DN11361_c0_g1_i1.p1 TRINITY_DN11361_c0_g1~~TRINITY_DN11361_c0_g1_i1.p1  ORF type:complete len:366 (-),score=69.23 TRINITY_DN11361_c0_g1_i1:58-1047(-)
MTRCGVPSFVGPRILTKLQTPFGMLHVCGGQNRDAGLAVCEHFDMRRRQWVRAREGSCGGDMMGTTRAGAGAAFVPPMLYVCGGDERNSVFGRLSRVQTSCEAWDASEPARGWRPRAAMRTPRTAHGAAAVGGCVYAVGGYDGERALSTVEKYDPRADAWTPVAPMAYKRSALAVSALGDAVYALGGWDPAVGEGLAVAECYDAHVDAWTALPQLPEPRLDVCSVASRERGCIYALAGVTYFAPDTWSIVTATLRLDPRAGRWDALAPVPTPRFDAAAAAVPGGDVYVSGGRCDGGLTAVVEVYDSVANMWRNEAPLPCPRYFHCATYF